MNAELPDRAAASEEIVVFKDVVKSYDHRPVLDGVSFTIRDGEHISLCGESMSGKSTIFKIIAGLVQPESGEVRVFGRDILNIGEREKQKHLQNIAMQFQSGALFDSMTVNENIMFVLDETRHLPKKEKQGRIDHLLKGVNLLSARNKYPYQLSGGMKKRVAVARALAPTPRLALFDEPAAGLDPVTSARIVNLIKDLVAEHQMTIMVSTTDVQLAMRFSTRFILLKNGHVHADAPWPELRDSDDEYARKFLSRALNA
ncbi:MAG: ATP-binding cassette domain-containing protein [Proteobacteria bacterium]|nr:ATP-binding cassette domain-containing protein [Pseudomonadota bacterium]